MKKTLLLILTAALFSLSSQAQTVITNDYGDSPITGADGQPVSSSDNDDEAISSFNVAYYNFDGDSNYGISVYGMNPNHVGVDFNIRLNFEKYGNYNVDLCLNYSFKLWGENGTKLLLVPSVGPSFRMQDRPKVDYNERTGNVKKESKTEYKFDLVANPRLALCANRFTFSVGYFLWGAEFKLKKGYKADGFNVALGYSF